MIFHLEPTGMGIRIALPGCGHPTSSTRESVSWMIRPARGEHPRLRNNTELKDVLAHAIVKRAGAGHERVGRVYWHEAHDARTDVGPAQFVVELVAPDEVFARIAQLAREGTPPRLELEPDGSGRIWDVELDPQITVKTWRAELQVTPDATHEAARLPSPVEAQLARVEKYLVAATAAAWAGAIATALLALIHVR